jgi:hypothetical protein
MIGGRHAPGDAVDLPEGPAPPPGSVRGHRLGARTADCVIEAWGPDRTAGLAEAMAALVEVFADCGEARVERAIGVSAGPAPDTDLPVHVHLAEASDGRVVGVMQVADPLV